MEYLLIIARTQKYLQTDLSRGVQFLPYYTPNITLNKFPKLVEARQAKNFVFYKGSEITKMFLTKPQ